MQHMPLALLAIMTTKAFDTSLSAAFVSDQHVMLLYQPRGCRDSSQAAALAHHQPETQTETAQMPYLA